MLRSRLRSAPLPPPAVLVPSVLIAAATLLPLAYLVFRAAGASGGLWSYLSRARSVQAVVTTLLLAFSVTTLSLAVALPVAWLTLRTRLPGRAARAAGSWTCASTRAATCTRWWPVLARC